MRSSSNSFGESVRAVWDLLRSADTLVGFASGREIRVETDPVQPVQLDGEPGGFTPFTATVAEASDTVGVTVSEAVPWATSVV